jgi:hypothetical protein
MFHTKETKVTEAEWLAATDPAPMLNFLREEPANQRRLRMFGCACCRRAWHLLSDESSQKAVEATEAWAEGIVSKNELWAACDAAEFAEASAPTEQHLSVATAATCISADSWNPSTDTASDEAAGYAADALTTGEAGFSAERSVQCVLRRCMWGNPCRRVAVIPTWRTRTVIDLAASAYAQRSPTSGELDSARLSLLADALEDAGCTDAELLGHLRGPGTHVLGCWAVDLVLGKS